MKKFFIAASGLDARGVGPRIMLITAPVLIAAIFFEIRSEPFADIVFLKNDFAKVAGWLWLATGIAAFITTMFQFISNFPKGKLITTGMFACSRNPIYSCCILFILPSFWLLFNNWIFLLSAIVMCVATIILVKEEEVELLKVFGKQYAEYRTKVGCIVRFFGKKSYE